MSRFWVWLLTHLSVLLGSRNGTQTMELQLRRRQRDQEEQLADARRRVQFLQDQTQLRGGGKSE